MRILKTSDNHRGFSYTTGNVHEKWAKRIANEYFDVVVAAGDHGSSKIDETHRHFKFLRRVAGTRPVLTVLGNHDFWNDPQIQPLEAIERHKEAARKYGVHMLDIDGHIVINDILFVGWMGWYIEPPKGNDFNNIPRLHPHGYPMNVWFNQLEQMQLAEVLKTCEAYATKGLRTTVGVTHFPIHKEGVRHFGNPRHMDFVKAAKIETLLYGHSHSFHDELRDGVHLVNAGSDYDKPKHVIVEVGCGPSVLLSNSGAKHTG